MAISCDRNWTFFSVLWEEDTKHNVLEHYIQLNSALNWCEGLLKSERFLQWFLPRYGETVIVMRAVFRDYGKLKSVFEDANVGASRIMLEFLQARNLNVFTREEPVKWVPRWLAKDLQSTQQMCELMGVSITPDSILKAIPFKDATVLHFAKTHYPEIGPELFKRITNGNSNWRGDCTDWEDYDDAFHAELMELKPRDWIYTGKSPKFKDFRPIYVFDSIAMKRFKCAWIDWQQQGMQAPMTEERYASWASKEMVIAPEGKAEPMVVKFLYLITFEKHGTTRLYATDEPVDRTNVTKVRASLENKRIQPPLGTVIRYEDLSVWTLEKSHVF
jgi:hypothetical protein